MNGTTSNRYYAATADQIALASDLTMVAFVTPAGTAANQYYFGKGNTGFSSGQGHIYQIGTSSADGTAFSAAQLQDGGGSITNLLDVTGSVTARVGLPTVLAASFHANSAGTDFLYINGSLKASAASVTGAVTTNTTSIGCLYRSGGVVTSTCGNAVIHACYEWNRALTPAEHQLLGIDPTCFLLYPDDDLFAGIVGRITIAASMVLSQGTDYGIFSGDVGIAASLSASQGRDYGQLSANEVVAAAVALAQAGDYGSLQAAVIVGAALALAQPGDFARFSGDEAISALMAGWPRGDNSLVFSDEGMSGSLTGFQDLDFGLVTTQRLIEAVIAAAQANGWAALGGVEVIPASLDAQQLSDFARLLQISAHLGFTALSDRRVNSAAINSSMVYSAAISDRALARVTLSDV